MANELQATCLGCTATKKMVKSRHCLTSSGMGDHIQMACSWSFRWVVCSCTHVYGYFDNHRFLACTCHLHAAQFETLQLNFFGKCLDENVCLLQWLHSCGNWKTGLLTSDCAPLSPALCFVYMAMVDLTKVALVLTLLSGLLTWFALKCTVTCWVYWRTKACQNVMEYTVAT